MLILTLSFFIYLLLSIIFFPEFKYILLDKVAKNSDDLSWNHRTPVNYINSMKSKPKKVSLIIPKESFDKITTIRNNAIKRGFLINSDRSKVKSKIIFKGDTLESKIRLKGDYSDHWGDKKKWSLRVQLKGENSILGMKNFSLQHPKTRSYINEYIFHKLLSQFDLITLRYEFVNVFINEEDYGIYALEEHFEKRLLENNNRKEGVIIRFPDAVTEVLTRGVQSDDFFRFTPLDAFQSKKISDSKILNNQFEIAKNLLSAFRNNDLELNHIFDVEKLATLFAVLDLTGHHHAGAFSNIRFYYNPYTSKLEPIGYDNQIIQDLANEGLQIEFLKYDDLMTTKIFSNVKFLEFYVKKLKLISQPNFLNDFFIDNDSLIKENLNIIYKDYPQYKYVAKKILYNNQKYIIKRLKSNYNLIAYKHYSQSSLSLLNIQQFPLEIIGLQINDSLIKPFSNLILPSKNRKNDFQYFECVFKTDSIAVEKKPTVLYRFLGLNDTMEVKVINRKNYDASFKDKDFIRKKTNYKLFKFLKTDTINNILTFKSGDWTLDKDLIIPFGFKINCENNFNLNMTDSSMILSYSPFEIDGNYNSVINFYSSDSSSMGISLINVKTLSKFNYCRFSNFNSPSKNKWALSGALNFYNSNVCFNNCIITKIFSEDAVNIVQSDFEINNTTFSNVSTDGLDLDFSYGEINNCNFYYCGNDAIDFSGSSVKMNNIIIENVEDKAISVSEKTNVTATNININNSNIAFTSKDLSSLKIKNCNVKNVKLLYAVFQKKLEYGPASVDAEKVQFFNVKEKFLLETNSKLTIDRQFMNPNNNDVENLLYGNIFEKKSNK